VSNQIVCHFRDGRLVKGRSFDFSPHKAVCRIQTETDGTVVVPLADLKALFLVRCLHGDPQYRDSPVLDPKDPRRVGARLLAVQFQDGETIVGLAPAYSEDRPFFFLLPVDPKSNNLRVLVNRAAAVSVKDAAPAPPPGSPAGGTGS
jgi:hypothetical protein